MKFAEPLLPCGSQCPLPLVTSQCAAAIAGVMSIPRGIMLGEGRNQDWFAAGESGALAVVAAIGLLAFLIIWFAPRPKGQIDSQGAR